jgi:hypothetical protein
MISRLRSRSFTWIKPNELKRRLEQGDAMAVIDVRGPDKGLTSMLGFSHRQRWRRRRKLL